MELLVQDTQSAIKRSFEIDPNQAGGWRLRLLENGVEVGGGAFLADEYGDALEEAIEWYSDGLPEGEDFLEMEHRTRC
jgi:hypothetical protein